MALVNTTLGAACAVGDKQITVALATGFAAGYKIHLGDEDMKIAKSYTSGLIIPVLRGQDGTVAVAHASGAQVTCGVASDWAQEGTAQTIDAYPIAMRGRVIREYSADGAIALPPAGGDAIAVISGTAHTGMTLAVPSKDLNGSRLTVLNLTAAAHVVTVAGGLGGGALVTMTMDATGRTAFTLLAYNEIWYVEQVFSGTVTSIDVALT